MAVPATARIVPISDISPANVGDKFRLFGILVLPEDPTSTIAQLHSLTASKGQANTSNTHNARESRGREEARGILVDISLCLDQDITALKESGSVVMVMGTVEYNTELSESSEALARLVDESIILRAILMMDASDVNLADMEAAITKRRNFERDMILFPAN